MNFLKSSKPAGIWWGTAFLGNSSWGTLLYIQLIYRVCTLVQHSEHNFVLIETTWYYYIKSQHPSLKRNLFRFLMQSNTLSATNNKVQILNLKYFFLITFLQFFCICIHFLNVTFSWFLVLSDNAGVCVYDKIFTNYNRNLRPVRNVSDPVEMEFQFVFRSLGGIVRL